MALYLKNKHYTLHIRIDKKLLDQLSNDYMEKKESSFKKSLTFSDYIRKILLVHVTRL